jgi:hypothetical protein
MCPIAAELVEPANFVRAIRDSGYKSTAFAIAELVDNSIQAGALNIAVEIGRSAHPEWPLEITVADDGVGMAPDALASSLSFGGTSRFDDRSSLGRYGMGLPNGSLSQARRVTVVTWSNDQAWSAHLDVDEVMSGRCLGIAPPVKTERPESMSASKSGFAVVLGRCDRIENKRIGTVASKLRRELGTIYRQFLAEGLKISVNSERVDLIDPLFLNPASKVSGATQFGDELRYELVGQGGRLGQILVCFTELPVLRWHGLSNGEKRSLGLTGGASVSILRAGREFDRGWLLMGEKRRENYDDWWRCEISFEPVLDEWFGITNSKQQISPSEELARIIAPDLEAIARALNARVRKSFEVAKTTFPLSLAETRATRADHLLPRLGRGSEAPSNAIDCPGPYSLRAAEIGSTDLYEIEFTRGQLVVTVNTRHPFYRDAYESLASSESERDQQFASQIGLLILAAARAEAGSSSRQDRDSSARFRHAWSDVLTTFLSA